MRFLPSPAGQGSSLFDLTLNKEGEGDCGGGGGSPFTWRDKLPEEFNTDPSLKDYKDDETGLVGAVKSLIHSQKMIGADKIALPGKDASSEEVAAFYQKLGAPEKPDGYEFAGPEKPPEGWKYPSEIESEFRRIAHDLHMPKGMAEKTWKELQETLAGRYDKATQTARLAHQERLDKFYETLGAAKDEKLKAMERAAIALGGVEGAAEMKQNGMLQEPVLMNILIQAADLIGSDKLSDNDLGGGDPGFTPAEAKARIAAINADPDLLDPKSPRQKVLIEEKQKLYALAYPNEKREARRQVNAA